MEAGGHMWELRDIEIFLTLAEEHTSARRRTACTCRRRG